MNADWVAGRSTMPAQRDYVVAGMNVLGVELDEARTEAIAEALYQDAGETYINEYDVGRYIVGEIRNSV